MYHIGGLAILIARHIEINGCLVWIGFKSSININTKKVMIGAVYVPLIDFFCYNGIKHNDIFLFGDFNARKSSLPDFTTDE